MDVESVRVGAATLMSPADVAVVDVVALDSELA